MFYQHVEGEQSSIFTKIICYHVPEGGTWRISTLTVIISDRLPTINNILQKLDHINKTIHQQVREYLQRKARVVLLCIESLEKIFTAKQGNE